MKTNTKQPKYPALEKRSKAAIVEAFLGVYERADAAFEESDYKMGTFWGRIWLVNLCIADGTDPSKFLGDDGNPIHRMTDKEVRVAMYG